MPQTTRKDVIDALDAHVYDLERELSSLKERLDRVLADLAVKEKIVSSLVEENRRLLRLAGARMGTAPQDVRFDPPEPEEARLGARPSEK